MLQADAISGITGPDTLFTALITVISLGRFPITSIANVTYISVITEAISHFSLTRNYILHKIKIYVLYFRNFWQNIFNNF
jgi:hypothetical protein